MRKIWTSSRPLYTSSIAILGAVLTACTTTPYPAPTTPPTNTAAPIVQAAPAPETCLTPGPIQDQARTFKANGFLPVDTQTYGEIAETLAACLGAPSPEIRDTIAYEGLTRLLRDKALSEPEMQNLRLSLMDGMGADDPDGFLQPFSALVLSEIVRADRVSAYLTPQQRQDVLDAGLNYLASVSDYRGFDEVEGWRHGVAHGADLLMQIALNPAFDRDDHIRILEAVSTKITVDGHAYIYNEGERLMRPIAFIWRAKTLANEDWTRWFESLVDPAPLTGWREAFTSQAGLNRLHNIKATLYPLFIQTSGGDPIPGLIEAISALP